MTLLSHLDRKGRARMVDVGAKPVTRRRALAEGFVRMSAATLRAVRRNALAKGDVLAAARLAGAMAAKRCAELIPLCHPLAFSSVQVELTPSVRPAGIKIRAEVSGEARTGFEMEAMTAVAVAALTIYDMAKSSDKAMVIGGIRLLEKSGGKSGTFRAKPAARRKH